MHAVRASLGTIRMAAQVEDCTAILRIVAIHTLHVTLYSEGVKQFERKRTT